MKLVRLLTSLILFLYSFLSLVIFPKMVYADAPNCKDVGINYTTTPSSPIPEGLTSIKITFSGVGDGYYRLRTGAFLNPIDYDPPKNQPAAQASNGNLEITINNNYQKLTRGTKVVTLLQYKNPNDNPDSTPGQEYCGFISYTIGYDFNSCKMSIYPPDPTELESIFVTVRNAPKGVHKLYFRTERFTPNPERDAEFLFNIEVNDSGTGGPNAVPPRGTPKSGTLYLINPNFNNFLPFLPAPEPINVLGTPIPFCTKPLNIRSSAGKPPRPAVPPDTSIGIGPTAPPGIPAIAEAPPCDNNKGISTAIGCIHTNPSSLVKDLLRFVVGISGGIAFLLMLLGTFQMITSAGNPQPLKEGQELFTNAIIGLLFIIFAVLLLQIVGADILGIPGFKR